MLLPSADSFVLREVILLVAVIDRIIRQFAVQFDAHFHLLRYRVHFLVRIRLAVRTVRPPRHVGGPGVTSQPRDVAGEEHKWTVHRAEMRDVGPVLRYLLRTMRLR